MRLEGCRSKPKEIHTIYYWLIVVDNSVC